MLGRELSSERARPEPVWYTTGMSHRWRSWFIREWPWLSYVVVYTAVFIVLMVFQSSPYFADPDSLYHAKMALLIRDQGVVHQFPWLQLTVLGQEYTDQHFLYHVLLIPFVTWLPPLIGLKLATVVFGASLFTVIFWMFRRLNVRWPVIFVLILLAARPFTFRISLAKAPSTSLIFLFLGLTWMFEYKLKRLFALAFAYVWYYGGFPLLGMTAGMVGGTSWLHNRLMTKFDSHRFVNKVLSLVGRHHRIPGGRFLNLKMVAATVGGLLAGLIINPYFPGNLRFYFHQLINIGIINFQNVIGVGNEWYPYNLGDLLANGALATLVLLIAVIGIVLRFRAQSKRSWALAVMTIFTLLLTLKSRRYVEYYIPMAVVFAAVSISDTFRGLAGENIRRTFQRWFWSTRRGRWAAAIIGVYLVFAVGWLAGRDFRNELGDLRQGFRIDKFQPVSAWLRQNTPAGSRIVHSDWDEFPVLFYQNSHNTYIVGLDPTFLYKASPETYWTWANITLGKFNGDLTKAVTETLQSHYVFVASGHEAMDQEFRSNPDFEKVYADTEATVYRVRHSV